MDKTKVDNLVRDLIRVLADLTGLHGELAMHMRNKLAAIKRADSDQIQSITARELLLAGRVKEREGLRRQITQLIVEGMGVASNGSRVASKTSSGINSQLRLTELAELLPEPRRSQLLVAAAGLRDKVEDIERMRVTTTLVTQEMLKHLGEVLSVMTAGGPGTDMYSRTGRRQKAASANVFEAVG